MNPLPPTEPGGPASSQPVPPRATPLPGSGRGEEVRLLQLVAAGDRAAFSRLYDGYSGVLHSTVLRILQDPGESAGVLQEVFVQIWDQAGAFDPAFGRPLHWMLDLARHRAIDRLRVLKRPFHFLEDPAMTGATREAGDGPDIVFTRDQSALARAALATLPLEQRQVIEMAWLGGLNHNEIAAALQQTSGTIKARVRRGMLRLRESLGGVS